MARKNNSADLALMIGAHAYVPLRTKTTRAYSTAMLTELVGEEADKLGLPDLSKPITHDVYTNGRWKLGKAATFAAIAGDSRLNTILDSWINLQRFYAIQMIDDIGKSVGRNAESLKVNEGLVEEGDKIRKEYTSLTSINPKDWTEKQAERFITLRKEMASFDKLEGETEKLRKIMRGVDRVQRTLRVLADSGSDSIHYYIPSCNDIEADLGDEDFDGPEFDPFEVSSESQITDIFSRRAPAPNIMPKNEANGHLDVDTLPLFLEELWRAYGHIQVQSRGVRIKSGEVKRELALDDLGARGLGSYMRDHSSVFGVEEVESNGPLRIFERKESGISLDKSAFIEIILKNLQVQDRPRVNTFYFERSLEMLRERREAYEGFTTNEIATLARNHHFPLTSQYIARNISDIEGVIRLSSDEKDGEKYRFVEVKPTHSHISIVKESISEFGINPIPLEELVRRMVERHGYHRISETIADKVITDNLEEWGLARTIDAPLQYQKIDRGSILPKNTDGEENTERRVLV